MGFLRQTSTKYPCYAVLSGDTKLKLNLILYLFGKSHYFFICDSGNFESCLHFKMLLSVIFLTHTVSLFAPYSEIRLIFQQDIKVNSFFNQSTQGNTSNTKLFIWSIYMVSFLSVESQPVYVSVSKS